MPKYLPPQEKAQWFEKQLITNQKRLYTIHNLLHTTKQFVYFVEATITGHFSSKIRYNGFRREQVIHTYGLCWSCYKQVNPERANVCKSKGQKFTCVGCTDKPKAKSFFSLQHDPTEPSRE